MAWAKGSKQAHGVSFRLVRTYALPASQQVLRKTGTGSWMPCELVPTVVKVLSSGLGLDVPRRQGTGDVVPLRPAAKLRHRHVSCFAIFGARSWALVAFPWTVRQGWCGSCGTNE